MYKIAVCDDEERARDEVKAYIKEWNAEAIVECFASGEELIANYSPYQVIFLDIDMKGINGIETGKRIREMDKETKIVYLTAYRDYVAGAFEVHAFQYLLKPVHARKLKSILDEVFCYVKRSNNVLDFKTVEGIVCLSLDDISYFEYANRRIRIRTEQKDYYMVERIGEVLSRLKPYGFSMPHQSFVVNMLHVKNIRGLDIYLDCGEIIPLAQKKQKIWKMELADYLSSRLERNRK